MPELSCWFFVSVFGGARDSTHHCVVGSALESSTKAARTSKNKITHFTCVNSTSRSNNNKSNYPTECFRCFHEWIVPIIAECSRLPLVLSSMLRGTGKRSDSLNWVCLVVLDKEKKCKRKMTPMAMACVVLFTCISVGPSARVLTMTMVDE